MASTIAIVANRMQAAMCVDWSLRRFGLGLVVSVDLWPVVDVARRAGVSQVLRSRDARAGSRLDPRVDAHHHHARASVVVSTSARICSCMSSMGICTAKPTNEGGVFPCIPASCQREGASRPGSRGRRRGGRSAHPASVKLIVLLFSDRENLLLLTLDGHRLHGKQAQPLCFARDAPRFSHRVQLGLACFACYAGDAVVQKIASSSYESCLDLSVRWPVWSDCGFSGMCLEPHIGKFLKAENFRKFPFRKKPVRLHVFFQELYFPGLFFPRTQDFLRRYFPIFFFRPIPPSHVT